MALVQFRAGEPITRSNTQHRTRRILTAPPTGVAVSAQICRHFSSGRKLAKREVTPFGVVDGTVPRVKELSEPSERGQHVGPPTITVHRLQDTRHRSCGSHRAQGRCSLRQGDSRPHQTQRDRQGRTKLLEPKRGSREEQPDLRPQRGRYRPPPFTDRIGASGIVGSAPDPLRCEKAVIARSGLSVVAGMPAPPDVGSRHGQTPAPRRRH